jgi:hypothetical protein
MEEIDALYIDLAKKEIKQHFGCSMKRLIGKKIEICYLNAKGESFSFSRKVASIEFRIVDTHRSPIFEAKICLAMKNKKGEPAYCLFKLFHPEGFGERPIVSHIPDNRFPFEFPRTNIRL